MKRRPSFDDWLAPLTLVVALLCAGALLLDGDRQAAAPTAGAAPHPA